MPPEMRELNLQHHGAHCIESAVSTADLRDIGNALADIPPERAGVRLHGIDGLHPFLAPSGPIGKIAASVLGDLCQPVRAILFDKTPATNWSLAWHQDRTIVVTERIEVDGFGPWTTKSDLLHVAPPFDLLTRLVTLRVHLDPVTATNAPLHIAPGSHRLGRIPESDIQDVVQRCGTVDCLAERGDIWVYSTPILHSSDAARDPVHRRVLQVDYASCDLPGGLTWLGI